MCGGLPVYDDALRRVRELLDALCRTALRRVLAVFICLSGEFDPAQLQKRTDNP